MEALTLALEARPLPGLLTPGVEVFAIGDVHGQARLLRAALSEIAAVPRPANTERIVVFLGDLIDRGTENIRAVETAMNATEVTRADRAVMLPGNHELALVEVLAGHDPTLWLQNGGTTVMTELDRAWASRSWSECLSRLAAAFPADWLSGIRDAPSHVTLGDLLFVHAGLDPKADRDVFLDRNRLMDDCHWATVRTEFIYWDKGWDIDRSGEHLRGPTIVVHGHTPAIRTSLSETTDELAQMDGIDGYRTICLDAGAAYRPQLGWARFWSEKDASMVQISATFAGNPHSSHH